MRRVTAGLGSLAIAAGVTTTLALDRDGRAAGRLQADQRRSRPPSTSCRIPPRRSAGRCARSRSRRCSRARRRSQKRGRQHRREGQQGRAGHERRQGVAAPDDQYVELAREKTDKIFVILAEFGNERASALPGPGHGPGHPGPDHVRRAGCTTRSRRPTARRTTRRSGSRTTTRSTTATCTSATGRDSLKSYYETPVLRPLQRRRHGHRLGEGPVQRGALRPRDGFPCADIVCATRGS